MEQEEIKKPFLLFLLSLAKASIKGEEVAILSVLADGVEWGGAQSTHRVATAAF